MSILVQDLFVLANPQSSRFVHFSVLNEAIFPASTALKGLVAGSGSNLMYVVKKGSAYVCSYVVQTEKTPPVQLQNASQAGRIEQNFVCMHLWTNNNPYPSQLRPWLPPVAPLGSFPDQSFRAECIQALNADPYCDVCRTFYCTHVHAYVARYNKLVFGAAYSYICIGF